jgi:hypothetical protein
MVGLTGRGVLPLLKLPNAGILATQSYSTEVGIPYVLCELKYFSVLRFRIRKIIIPVPGVKKVQDPGSGSATLIIFYIFA